MPDVGALNLTIKSNATMAANGLNNLADALVRVKAAVGKGLGLGTVGTQVKQLAKTINEAQGTSTVVKNLASLFNAISNFSKLKSVKIDVKPFRELKDAIGDGISLGQAGAQMLKMREAMEGQWNGDSAVSSMNQVASASSVFKTEGTAKTLASVAKSMTEYAKAAKAMQKSGIVEMHGGGTPGADVQSRIKLNLQQLGKNIKKETEPVYEQLKMDLDSIARDSAFDKMAQSIDKCFGPVENLDSGVQDVQKSIANTTAEAGQYSEGINRALDFSKFDVSKLPMDRIGEKLGEAGQQVQMFKDTVQTTGETTTSIIAYNENLATSWEAICARMAESGRLVTFGSVEETAKFLGMSVDDVKKRLQETYNMVYEGKRQGTIFSTLEQAAKELGITVEEVNKELQKTFEMVYGKSIDSGFNDATESIKESTQAAEAFKESVGEIAESVVAGEKKIELLIQKADIIEAQANKRINMLLETGRDPDRDKTLVNYKLQIMALNAEIEKLTDVESRKFRSGSMLDFSEQSSTIEAYKMKLQALKSELEEGIKTGLWDDKKIANAIIQIDQLTGKIEKLEDQQAGQALLISSEDALKAAENFLEANDDISILKMRLEELKMQMGQGILSGNMDATKLAHLASQIRSVTEKIKEMENATKKSGGLFTKFASGASTAFGKLKNVLKETFPLLNKINHQFGRILMRRAITAVIRSITKAFKEGVENVYKYSEAIGSSFAPALDSAKSMIAQFKNSIGAAAAPLIQALIPVFNQIVSAAIQVINVLNQLFALLGGQSSWTRALPTMSKAFEDTKNAAKGAGGAVKDMLADFDELNVLDQGGGGGGGAAAAATAEAYEDMFEQVDEFDKKIRDFVGWLEDHLSVVHGVLAGIAALLLGLPLSISIGIGLIVTGIEDSYNAGYDIGTNGLNRENIVKAAKGVLETTLGGALIGWKLGGPGGALLGAMVGFTIGMVMVGIGMSDAERDKLYGNVHWESDRLEQELNKLFKYDNVKVAINELHADHFALEQAKKDLITELEEMNLDFDYDKIKLGINKKETLEKMMQDVNNVVAATNALIVLRKKSINVGLQVTTQFDDPEKVISFSDKQWNDLDKYVTGLGNQIGEILSDGISIDEVDVINRLQKQLSNVTQAIAYGQMAGKFVGDIQKGYSGTEWENLDKETLQAYTGQYIEAKNELMDAFRIQAEDTKESLGALYFGMLQRNIDNPGSVSKEALETARQNWLQFDIDQDVIDKWVEYGEEGRQIYTQNVASALSSVVDRKGNKWNSELATKSVLKNNLKNIREWIVTNIADNIGFDEKILIEAFNAMEFTGWEVLGEDARKKMIYEMQRQFGINSGLYSELKNQMNVPIDDILATNSYAWERWGTKERLRFCQAIVDAYGAPAAIEAARAAGIDIQAAIDEGILEGGEVGNTAEQLKNQIDAELAKNPVNVDVNANVDVMIDALVSVKTSIADGFTNAISAITKTAQVNIQKPNNKNKNALKASGAYGIPAGDLFIANEQGAELVGSMNGKTTVANQGQIIEGISTGVERANEEQNALLREQNNLLRRLLEKDATVRIGASAALGRTVKQSLDMYGGMAGG